MPRDTDSPNEAGDHTDDETILRQVVPETWSLLVERLRPRSSFRNRPATKIIVVAILAWYLVQLTVWIAGLDAETLQWLFTTRSFPDFSPGLLFAGISHSYPNDLGHLFANVATIWVFTGESEPHLGSTRSVGLFVVTAVLSVNIGTLLDGRYTLGASGAALAFVSFYVIHSILEHREALPVNINTSENLAMDVLQRVWNLVIWCAVPLLIAISLAQLSGLVAAGNTDVYGHLTGILCGVAYAGYLAAGRPLIATAPPGSS